MTRIKKKAVKRTVETAVEKAVDAIVKELALKQEIRIEHLPQILNDICHSGRCIQHIVKAANQSNC
jgi:hypothetical protein